MKIRMMRAKILSNEIEAGDLVLVKGSRGVRTEKVIEKLLEKFELENENEKNSDEDGICDETV